MQTPTGDVTSHPASSSTETLLAEEVGEDKELDDGLWEDDGANDKENSVLKSAHETASSTTMDVEVDDGVDVGVPQLRDYLSDRPASSPLVNVGEGPNVMKKAAGSSAPRVFEVREMTF